MVSSFFQYSFNVNKIVIIGIAWQRYSSDPEFVSL